MGIHSIDLSFKENEIVSKLTRAVRDNRGNALLVGGCVRDAIFGIEPKDIDIEVYGLPVEELRKVLQKALPGATVNEVGVSFGVFKVRTQDGQELDISLPRKDSVKLGEEGSHRGFTVQSDPYMSIKEACGRRDYTVNSMAYDPILHILYDYYNGMEDIENFTLRMTDKEHFGEDPLRVLRGIQFAARWGFRFDLATTRECRNLLEHYPKLAKERVWVEWQKLFLKGRFIGLALQELQKVGWLGCYPALANLVDCEQEPSWHPEGKVITHAQLAGDMALGIAEQEKLNDNDRTVLILAAILHDVGKPTTTTLNERGQIISPGHAEAGEPIAIEFMESIGVPQAIIEQVAPLVREHMCHIGVKPNSRIVRRLANRLSQTTIRMLAMLVMADASGRYVKEPPVPLLNPMAEWVNYAVVEKCETGDVEPILMGRHLISWGMKPGREMGVVLKEAYQLQLDGVINDLPEAMEWLEKVKSESEVVNAN